MFKNKLKLTLSILLLVIVAFAGCKSKYEKLLASSDTAKKYREAVKTKDARIAAANIELIRIKQEIKDVKVSKK